MNSNSERNQRETFYRAMVESYSETFFLVTDDGKISFCSDTSEQLTGYTPKELTKLSFTDLVFVQDQHLFEPTKEAFALLANNPSVNFRINHKSGNKQWVEAQIRDKKSTPGICAYILKLRAIGITTNISNTNWGQTIDLEVFFANSIDLICIADTNGFFRKINPEWSRTLGYTINELLGKPFLDFVHPDDIESTINAISKLSEQNKVEGFINRYKHKNGTYRYIEWRSYPIGEMIYASARDVTHRKEAELRMNELLNLHSVIFDEAGYCMIVTDKDGSITMFNHMAEKILGYSAKEVIGKMSIVDFHDKNELLRQAAFLSKKLEKKNNAGLDIIVTEALNEKPQEYEWTYLCKDGKQTPVSLKITALKDGSNAIKGFIGIAADITDRRETLEALRESERKFSEIYNLIPDIVGISRISDGHLININPAFYEITNYKYGECSHKTIFELGLWKTPEEYKKVIEEIRQHKVVKNTEFVLYKKDGDCVHCLLSVKPIVYNKEECLLFIIHDITERKKAEEVVLQNETRLQSIVNIMQFSATDTSVFLDFVLDEAIKLTQSKIGYIYHYNEEKQEFTLNSWSKEVMNECSIANPLTCYALDKTGLWGEAVRQRKPIILNNFTENHPVKKGYPKGHAQLNRFLTIPVFNNENIIAVVGVANKQTDYNNTDILQLTLLMDAAWKVLNKADSEKALLVSEKKYRKLFENMNGGFAFHEIIFDTQNQPIDFKYIDANKKFYQYWNIEGELIGKTAFEIFPFADKSWIDIAWNVISSGIPYSHIDFLPSNQMYIEAIEFKIDETHFATIFNDVTDRIKAEQALKESEFRYRSIVDNMPIGFGVADINGNILYNNKTFFSYFGFDESETPTITAWTEKAYPDPDYRKSSLEIWNKDIELVKGGEALFSPKRTYKICTQTGNFLDVEITFTIIGNEVYTIFVDNTEKNRALTNLMLSEQKFSDIYTLLPDAINIQKHYGTILEANPAFSVLTGYSPVEYIGNTTLDLGLWVNPSQREEIINDFIKNGEITNYEVGIKTKKGNKLTCLMSLKPFKYKDEQCVLSIIHDITQQKETEKALLAEKKFTNSLLDSMPGLVYMYDENGYLIRWNTKHESETGYTADELQGKHILSWFDDNNKNIIIPQIESIKQGGYTEIEAALTLKNGTQRQYYFTAIQTRINDNAYLLGIGLDITDRKLANESLRQMEQRFQNIFNLTPDMVGITSLSDGKILMGNPATEKHTGFTPEEYIGHTTFELSWWANLEDRQTMINVLKEKGEIRNMEIGMRRKSGEILDCLFSAKTLTFDNTESLLFVVHDITELKNTEKALQKRIIALTKPLDDPEGIDFTDLFNIDDLQKIQDTFAQATGVASIITYPDGTPITKPGNFCKLCNIIRNTDKGRENCFKSDAFLGKQNHSGPSIHPCYSGGLWDAGASITLGGRHMANWLIGQVKNEAQDPNSILKYAQEIGADFEEFSKALEDVPQMSYQQFEKISQALFVLANELSVKAFQNVQQARFITEQKEFSNLLLKQEYFLRRSQEVANVGSYILNISDPNPKNQTWESTPVLDAIFGLPQSFEKTGENWLKLMIQREVIEKYVNEEVIGKKQKFEKEYQIIRPIDQEARWIYGSGELEYGKNKKPLRLIGTIQDITEKKKKEDEIRLLNATLESRVAERTAQLEQANKDLEAFAYSISHDLRAPLRHVDGFIRLLYSNIQQPSETVTGYFEKISTASKRMSIMIDDLLTFSRLGRKALVISPVNLEALVWDIIEHMKPDIINQEVQWIILPLPIVNADHSLLRMALENLLSNALKYSQKKPKTIIEMGTVKDEDNNVEFYIKDNGVGFDMAYAEKLFGVFQRLHTNEEFEGTGIGLANVKQIINKHKGLIRGEGKLNEGATFFITLPKQLKNE
jgi:PAS domain S-box-containing protein